MADGINYSMPAPDPFNFSEPEMWIRWIRRFERYREASGLSTQDEGKQIDTLIYMMGDKAEDILQTFNLTEANKKKYKKVRDQFESHFISKRNVIYERAKFNSRKQGENESVESFITDLFAIAEHCNYNQLHDELIRDRIVIACKDARLSEKLQLDPDLTLEKAIRLARNSEAVKSQQNVVRNHTDDSTVHALSQKKRTPFKKETRKSFTELESKKTSYGKSSKSRRRWQGPAKPRFCGRCGSEELLPRSKCPAISAKCSKCNIFGHYAKMCRTKSVHELADEEEVPFLGTVSLSKLTTPNPWRIKANISSKELEFKIDSGADVTAIPEKVYSEDLGLLVPSKGELKGPSKIPIKVTGKFYSDITVDNIVTKQEIYVVPGLEEPLLGRSAIEELNILKINEGIKICNVNKPSIPETRQKPEEEFQELFQGLGQLKETYKIELKDDVKPYSLSTPRRIAIPLLPHVETELKRLEEQGVISKVERHTDWCCGIVVVPKKNGKIRICADLTKLNKCVKREKHILPSVDHLLGQLAGAKVMSKLDANSGYYQIVLDPESRELTTFITPLGRYCFNRLPFGITSACEIYQKRMSRLVEGIPGVLCMIDDILVFGKSQEEHDERLRQVFTKLKTAGVTLNRSKCEFSKSSLTFLGHIISADGLKPDPQKIQSIQEFEQPEDVTAVRRFLGMANQLGKFAPHLSETTKPLRDLISHKSHFVWGSSQEMAFKAVKQLLSSEPVLALYDCNKETVVSADSSAFGLGAILLQYQTNGELKPVAYASRVLSEPEKHYMPK